MMFKITVHTVCLSFLLSCAAAASPQPTPAPTPQYTVTTLFTQQSGSYDSVVASNNRNEVIAYTIASFEKHGAIVGNPVTITNGIAQPLNFVGEPTGINDLGEIVGHYGPQNVLIAGAPCFIYRPSGPYKGVRLLPAQFYNVLINNKGTLAGQYLPNNSDPFHTGYLDKNGVISTFNSMSVCDLNNADQVTGEYIDSAGFGRAYLYSNGRYIDLGRPATAGFIIPSKMNDYGQIVGTVFYGSITHPFIYYNGVLADLGLPPGATYGGAEGINNSGVVIGYSGAGQWIYESGVFSFLKDLIPAGYVLTGNVGLNERGQIIEAGQFASDQLSNYLFLLTPEAVK